MELHDAIEKLIERLNEIEKRKHLDRNPTCTFPADLWHTKKRRLFIALDVGGSGAFLVEKKTGEIFNIRCYGRPDYNKKAKANLGNILTADPETVHAKRWNYLR